jgi:hypothetical protein
MEVALMPALGIVRQVPLPADARAISTLGKIDYEDAFRIDSGQAQDRTAEEWARAILDDAPPATRDKLSRGWAALGIRLGSADPRPDRVLGWEIRRSTPDVTLLGARGRVGMSGELLFRRQPDALLFSTMVRLDNPVVRKVWTQIEARHRQIVHDLLADASTRLLSA